MNVQVGFALAESTVSLSEYRKLRNENAALKLVVEKLTTTNTAILQFTPDILESDNVCDYCVEPAYSDRCSSCNTKKMFNNFIGRKLQAGG